MVYPFTYFGILYMLIYTLMPIRIILQCFKTYLTILMASGIQFDVILVLMINFHLHLLMLE